MGVRFLTNFVAENAQSVLATASLDDSVILIDGYNILHEIYYESSAQTAYGGDYDVFAQGVAMFCDRLKSRRTTPYFVFDGASDVTDWKFGTLLKRAKERIHLASLSTHRKRAKILPCLAFRTFIDKLEELNVAYCVCDHEADSQLASLALEWNCPLVSNDSDFLLHDLPGGVISVKELDVSKIIGYSSQSSPSVLADEEMKVRIYYNRKLMELYDIKDPAVFTVLSVISGNDLFYHERLQRFRSIVQGSSKDVTDFDKILRWLAKHETVEKAIDAVVRTQGGSKVMKKDITDTVSTYKPSKNQLADYFYTKQITHDGHHPLYSHLPDILWTKYRQAVIPKKILDILIFRRRIFAVQMEKLTNPSAWHCSSAIRRLTYQILSASSVQQIKYIKEYDREGKKLFCNRVPVPQTDLPAHRLCTLYETTIEHRLRMFYTQLGLTEEDIENGVVKPQCTQRRDNDILTAILIHWINNANPHVFRIHVAALLVCIIDLSLIKVILPATSPVRQKTAQYDHKPTQDQKHKEGLEIDTIHALSQFQAVLSDSLDLLGLLGIDTDIRVHHIFSGRYIYNLCVELLVKRTQPGTCCEDLLIRGSDHSNLFKSWHKVILDNVNPDYLKEVGNSKVSEDTKRKHAERKSQQAARRKLLEELSDSNDDDSNEDTDDSGLEQLVGNKFAALTMK